MNLRYRILATVLLLLCLTRLGVRGQEDYDYGGDIAWMRGAGGGGLSVESLHPFPDGQRLLVNEQNLKIYDLATGNVLKALVEPFRSFIDCDLSRDGKWIAGGGDEGVVIWDAETGQVVRQLNPGFIIESVGFSADKGYLAVGSINGLIRIWQTKDWREEKTFNAGTYSVSRIRFSQYGDTLVASSGETDGVKMWDVSSGELLWSYEPPYRISPPLVAFSPDGRHLAVAPNHQEILLVEMGGEFASRKVIDLNFTQGTSLAFSPDGKHLAMGMDHGALLWETEGFTEEPWIAIPHLKTMSLAFSSDSRFLYSGGANRGDVMVSDVNEAKWLRILTEYTGLVIAVDWSSDGTLVAGVDLGLNFVHNAVPGASGEVVARLVTKRLIVCHQVTFSPDGRWLAGTCADSFRIWRTDDWEERPRPRTRWITSVPLRSIAWMPDSRYVAISSGGYHIWLYDVELDTVSLPFKEDSIVWRYQFTPDGKVLIGVRGDGSVLQWDTESGDVLNHIDGKHTYGVPVSDLDISADGTSMVTCAWDGRILIWDLTTLRPTREVFHDGVLAVSMTPDGRHVVSGGKNREIYVWETATGKRTYVYNEHPYDALDLEISPDGKYIAAGTYDGLVVYHGRWETSGLEGEEVKKGEIAWGVRLRKLYPNPSDDIARLLFVVEGDRALSLRGKIYNEAGAEVGMVVERRYEPGEQEMTLPVGELESGSYIVRLEGEGVSLSASLQIVR